LPHHEEGSSQSGWLVIDYGNVIIHILTPEKREYYQLEKIWQNAGTILTIQ
jgi:ribosome-associated protein